MNILCTICSDQVNQAENIFATNCGHIFHYNCLAEWIKRSKSCPQCRHTVSETSMFRIYPTVSNENLGEDVAILQSQLDAAHLQLRRQQASAKEKDKKNEEVIKNLEEVHISVENALTDLKMQLDDVKKQNKKMQFLKEENDKLTKALFEFASKKSKSRVKLQAAKEQIETEKRIVSKLQAKIVYLEDELLSTKRKYNAAKGKWKPSDGVNDSKNERVRNEIRYRPRKPSGLPSAIEQNPEYEILELKLKDLSLSAQPTTSDHIPRTDDLVLWDCVVCGRPDYSSTRHWCVGCHGWYHWYCEEYMVKPKGFCKNCVAKRTSSASESSRSTSSE